MLGQRRNFVSTGLEFPNEHIAGADQERDDAQTPGAALPVVHRTEEDHQSNADHHEDNSAAQIRARFDGGRRNSGGHAGRGSHTRGDAAGLSRGRGRGCCWGLAEDAQSERNRAEADKKCCFHKYPFAVRCGGGRIWIQKRECRAGTKLERVTRLELATSSLARRCSTTELHPQTERVGIMSTASARARFLSERHAGDVARADGSPPRSHSFAAARSPGARACPAASKCNVTFAPASRSIAARRSAFS